MAVVASRGYAVIWRGRRSRSIVSSRWPTRQSTQNPMVRRNDSCRVRVLLLNTRRFADFVRERNPIFGPRPFR